MNVEQIGRMLQQLEARITRIENSPRLSHAALDNTSLEVRDVAGGLRGLLGVQADGTTAVNVVNGPTPPAPSAPVVAPALAALEITWDGGFADGQVAPLDWQRVEVHVGPNDGFTPGQGTLRGTIESPQGGTVTVPLPYTEWYVRLRSRTTSGVASVATDTAAATPRKADTQDLTAGAVTADTIAVDALTGKTITGGTMTGAVVQTAESGQRITLNEADANRILVYSAAGTVIGELSAQGLFVRGTNGAMLVLDPNDTFPNLRLTNAARTNSAVINVSSNNAVLGMNSGTFPADGATWKWRTVFGQHNNGNESWFTERFKDGSGENDGGRIFLGPAIGTFGYRNSVDPSKDSYLVTAPGVSQFIQSRLEILSVTTNLTALLVNTASSHTGNLIRALLGGSEKFAVDKDGNTSTPGVLTAGNIASGRATVTPTAANTPTSVNVGGINIKGSNIRVVATASTLAPGTIVTGVGVTNVTSTGFTLWLTRTNTTSTGVDWIAIGS